jgi:hypothetical protein
VTGAIIFVVTTADQIRLGGNGGQLDYISLKSPGQTHSGCSTDTFLTHGR